jgi:hypothetical protein
MRRTAMLWEVFVTRFQEAFKQYEKHRLSSEEVGELTGMSRPNFRRLCVRYEEDGIEGLRDRRVGKVSPRRAPACELEDVLCVEEDRVVGADNRVSFNRRSLQRPRQSRVARGRRVILGPRDMPQSRSVARW